MSYTGAWIHELQATTDEIQAKTQFGWTPDHKSFVLGNREIFADRIAENTPSFTTAQYFSFFEKKGTLEGWMGVSNFYNRPNFAVHQYMFGLAFGSPLMEFIDNISGGIYHVCSTESGYGKTTGMYGGASVWGNYKKLVLKGDDTVNSVWNRAEVYKNLPLYVDEITNVPGKFMSEFAYKATSGEQRSRMSNTGQNKERYRGDTWSLLVGTSANVSLLEKITEFKAMPKGEHQRIIESEVYKLLFTPADKLAAQELNRAMAENFGHAGEIYIQYVVANLDAVKALLRITKAKLDEAANLSVQNRVWSAQGAVVITGLLIARKLGLINWDTSALRQWVVGKLQTSKGEVAAMEVDITDTVCEFYAENIRGVLRIRSTDDQPTVSTGLDMLVVPEAMPMYNWVARHEYDTHRLYLMVKPFKLWCIKQQLNYASVQKRIISDLRGKKERIRMGRGTTITLAPMHVLSMEWTDGDYAAILKTKTDQLNADGHKS